MKVGVAQIRSVKGDIPANIAIHEKYIGLAAAKNADIIVFPELSVTGYEPALAKELSMYANDERLSVFRQLSVELKIVIGIGVPLKTAEGIQIGLLIFQSQKPVTVYAKRYLHEDEVSYFISGQDEVLLRIDNQVIAPAICYELSVPAHAAAANAHGATIYLASVAKTESGIQQAMEILAAVAAKYSMPVLIANAIGPADNFLNAGRSSVWNNKGILQAQLKEDTGGLLIWDTETEEVIAVEIASHS